MYCPNCGAENPPRTRFCQSCGAPLTAKAVEPAAPRRPLWPWIVLGLVLLSALVVLVVAFLTGPARSQTPAPATPAPETTEIPAVPEGPGTEIIVVTPEPPTLPPPTPTLVPATPVPATPTPVPVTPAPEGDPEPVSIDADLQYRINIFLSNFSEQGFGSFDVSTASDDQMIHFVHIYCKINQRNSIVYDGGYETISKGDTNDLLRRFFNVDVDPYEGASYFYDCSYHDGKFWWPAADGESYNYFTVVDSMVRNPNGSYTVNFQIYELSLEEYWNTPGVDSSFYKLTPEKAADMVWDYRIFPVKGGTAVVWDYTKPNGAKTFRLASYEVWDIEFHY